MKKIASFTIDHTRLEPGIYLSRTDRTPSGDLISTYDIRMTRPNREEALSPRALHAMEHLVATFLRNHPVWADRIIYWGPMGCCTGNYLLINGEYKPEHLLPLIKEAMTFVKNYEGEIPGASPRDCGNYSFMDLPEAKRAASRFLDETLSNPSEINFNYPQ